MALSGTAGVGFSPYADLSNFIVKETRELQARVTGCLRAFRHGDCSDTEVEAALGDLLRQKQALASSFSAKLSKLEDDEYCDSCSLYVVSTGSYFSSVFNEKMSVITALLGQAFLHQKTRKLQERLDHLKELSSEFLSAKEAGVPKEELVARADVILRLSEEIRLRFSKIPGEFLANRLTPSLKSCLKLQQQKQAFLQIQKTLIDNGVLSHTRYGISLPDFFKNTNILELQHVLVEAREAEKKLSDHDAITRELRRVGTIPLPKELVGTSSDPFTLTGFGEPIARSGKITDEAIRQAAKREEVIGAEERDAIRKALSSELSAHLETFRKCLEAIPYFLQTRIHACLDPTEASVSRNYTKALAQILHDAPEYRPGPSEVFSSCFFSPFAH